MACAAVLLAAGGAPARPAVRQPLQYLALGDSVAAGEGLPRADDRLGRICHQSRGAYPFLVRRELAQAGSFVRLLNLACSAATSSEVFTSSQRGLGGGVVAAQLHRVGRLRPGVITITVGLNDLRFDRVLERCLIPTFSSLGTAASMRRRCLSSGPSIDRGLTHVRLKLGRILTRLRASYPGAHIFVTGYYEPWPPTGSRPLAACRREHGALVASLLTLASADGAMNALRGWQARLNATLRAVARSHRAVFVSLTDAFAGHEFCARKEWVVFPTVTTLASFAAFHPTAAGQRRIASLVTAAIRHARGRRG